MERELGITQGLLAKWRRKQTVGAECFGRSNLVKQSKAEKELAQLRRENAVLNIVGFYNRTQLHSHLDYCGQIEFENHDVNPKN